MFLRSVIHRKKKKKPVAIIREWYPLCHASPIVIPAIMLFNTSQPVGLFVFISFRIIGSKIATYMSMLFRASSVSATERIGVEATGAFV